MTETEADLVAQVPGVVSVFQDIILKLHTTRSWSFLENQELFATSTFTNFTDKGADLVIGVVDSGVWPESKSFNDQAVGAAVSGVSYYGLAAGTAMGGSPNSRIAIYKVCDSLGCSEAAMLPAMDAAIYDGVDIMSLSIGEGYTDIWTDPVAIGGFHAIEHGIMVVCSAGNYGPTSSSVVNFTPWLTTVGASNIDQPFIANVVLGIQFSGLSKSPTYPLIDGVLAKVNGSEDSASRNCQSGSLDASKVKGKIILCFNEDEEGSGKAMNIMDLGGLGVVLLDDDLYLEPKTDYPDLACPLTTNLYGGNVALKSSGALSIVVP
ncbi:CO(2)-response secreted protease-like [Apium graveolens]|uniref:CO(2)-response secreted protease-like n=1 Tax=Apium graveolens TaxID=4045 RepID=UPI003D7B579E